MKKILFCIVLSVNIFAQENYIFYTSRIELPMDNKGTLGYYYDGTSYNGRYDDIPFLFSAGFFLSGINADTIWGNGVASSALIEDYLPGNVDSAYYDPKYIIYVVRKNHPPFSESWLKWRYAVQVGADFYDGNHDGIYNPIDLNGNNQWDPNEDKPDLIGDITTWCVYSDSKPSGMRLFNNNPLGIEIQQTVFGFTGENNIYDSRNNIFFVRYKIINTGKVSSILDSVYFAQWADTDLGVDYDDDLTGCDTLHSSGYVYKENNNYPDWGSTPPAHFMKILQGPFTFIPGETFIDNNSNGIYEEGIDTPIDTAYNFKGELIGIDILPGAKNLGMTAFTGILRTSFIQDDPRNSLHLRNYMLGLDYQGNNYNPCTFYAGNILGGVDCSKINPVYMYSGDPVNQIGWLNNLSTDQRQFSSTGPFKLEAGKSVNIITTHIVGRGYDHLNSITRARSFSSAVETFYKSNFTNIPVSVEDEISEPIVSSFQLYQNYPNPFNPTTNIGFRIMGFGLVTLKIYDVLGNEIAALVNEEKPAGSYNVQFDGSNLSSGIYIYRLISGNYISAKKMLMIK